MYSTTKPNEVDDSNDTNAIMTVIVTNAAESQHAMDNKKGTAIVMTQSLAQSSGPVH